MFAKHNLQPCPDIMRVTVRKSKHILFVIPKPDVWKCSNDTYVIIGEARIEDLSAQQASDAAQMFNHQKPPAADGEAAAPAAAQIEEVVEEAAEDETADAGDLDEKDIDLVMSQVFRKIGSNSIKSTLF